MEEIFKDIPGYEGLYQASNLGNIKSLKYNKGRILKGTKNIKRGGYMYLHLCKNNKPFSLSVHRLIAKTFLIQIDNNKKEVNHINGKKDDNKLENLEWCTRSENVKHQWNNGLIGKEWGKGQKGKFGKNHPMSKKIGLFQNDILIGEYESMTEATQKTTYCMSTISKHLKGIYGNGKRNKKYLGFKWKYL